MHALLYLLFAHGLTDRGIFPEYDGAIGWSVPRGITAAHPRLRVDSKHRVVTLYDGRDALKAWPIVGGEVPAGCGRRDCGKLSLRPDDEAELSRLTGPDTPLVMGAPPPDEDHDGDGIVDQLDILVGAKKLTLNKAKYIERYVSIKFPGGDVPRTEGVCTDTVIRALRNAGIDLQKEVHDDILRAPKSYAMVEKVDPSINHRRVRTILPWFQRHFTTLPPGERYLPGDIVFLDTFPSKPGPDHLGVVSDSDVDGRLTVINNWTNGAVDAEMELLSWVPVTHHFRAPVRRF